MIISFSVSNFRSFSSEQTLSLVASNRLSGSHEDHACSIPGTKEKVLKTAVLYGANGAGKSNLFNALRYLRTIALKPRKKNSGMEREKFRFGAEADEPSVFDLQFIVDSKLYRYGAKIDDYKIIEEWLYEVVGSKQKSLYERITDEQGNVRVEAGKTKFKKGKLGALFTVGGLQNQSFLATIQATLDSADYDGELANVINWFDDNLTFIGPDSSFGSLGHLLASDSTFLTFAGDFLRAASTGITHLQPQKTEISEEELRNLLPKKFVSKLLEDIVEDKDGTAVISLEQGNELLIERIEENHFYRLSIQAAHEHQPGKVISLDLSEESDGTRRLLNLLPALHFLQTSNAVFFIDEIDRSMHPILAKQFLEFFLKSCQGGRHQIIITTHESNLLDLELLRRDEIWFVEKDQAGASHLYSLADFNVRTDQDIRRRYLQGRYGAIPFLGDLNALLGNENLSQ
ncbi:AAA family ATPase [Methylomonas rhizoryzae]|uniref:AAA family ATPase n=1 Tax=Methylomonas rhizoryzae TaxID=2608981 RepID=UPI0012319324|nr:ATP-binding protein [Methylomonas rhizoryzae]